MNLIENIFSDFGGNHLMVALDFCDEVYKRETLRIPEEYSDIEIVDISIEKAYLDKPLGLTAFFRMSDWLSKQFELYDNAVFAYICSTDELVTNHSDALPQFYRWLLFDRLYQRLNFHRNLNVQNVIVGPEGYQTYGRAFYRDKHAPIIHIVTAHLQEKQRQYT